MYAWFEWRLNCTNTARAAIAVSHRRSVMAPMTLVPRVRVNDFTIFVKTKTPDSGFRNFLNGRRMKNMNTTETCL